MKTLLLILIATVSTCTFAQEERKSRRFGLRCVVQTSFGKSTGGAESVWQSYYDPVTSEYHDTKYNVSSSMTRKFAVSTELGLIIKTRNKGK